MADDLKLMFRPQSCRVVLKVTPAATLSIPTPPPGLMRRAEARMKILAQAGRVKTWELYPEKLAAIWEGLRSLEDNEKNRVAEICITLAQGSPLLPGFILTRPPEISSSLISVSFGEDPEVIKAWHFRFMRLLLKQKLKELNLAAAPNLAVLQALWINACAGEKIQNAPIPAMQLPGDGKGFSISSLQHGRIVVLNIFEPSVLERSIWPQIKLYLEQTLSQLSGFQFEFFFDRLRSDLRRMYFGRQRFGWGLPTTSLAAIGRAVAASPLPEKKEPERLTHKPAPPPPDHHPLGLSISLDGMTATIAGFNPSHYENPDIHLDLVWLKNELENHKIVAQDPKVMERAAAILQRRGDLNGLVIAQGVPGVPAKEPYLAAAQEPEDRNSGQSLRRIVRFVRVSKGDLVAEIRCHKAAVPSSTIFGAPGPMPDLPEFQVELKGGVEARGSQFFATADGIPAIAEHSIGISATLVHNGNVDLKTGDIEFDGPILINGSVEHGASVTASGPIEIKGSVTGGVVRSRGNLVVSAGISNSSVFIRGDLRATFIEQSTIRVAGSLMLKTALLNSETIVGSSVRVSEGGTGLIAGGRLVAGDCIETPNLGYPSGIRTHVMLGVPWVLQNRLERAKSRLRSLRAMPTTKLRPGTNQEHRLEKIARLKANLERKIVVLKNSLQFAITGTIRVKETLRRTALLQIGQYKMSPLSELEAVGIVVRRKGLHSMPLAELGDEASGSAA